MKKKTITLTLLGLLLLPVLALAADKAPTVSSNAAAVKTVQTHLDYVWTLVTAALVFFMQAGFAMVEAGFTRAKNAVNIMMKNLMDFAFGSLAFWAIGFGLMFGVTQRFFRHHRFFLQRLPCRRRPLGAGLLDVPVRVRRHRRHHRLRRHG